MTEHVEFGEQQVVVGGITYRVRYETHGAASVEPGGAPPAPTESDYLIIERIGSPWERRLHVPDLDATEARFLENWTAAELEALVARAVGAA